MKQTPIKRKTPLRQISAKRAAAMSTDKRRPAGAPALRATTIKASTKRMRQVRSTCKPTAAQAARFQHIRSIGCIASLLDGRRVTPEVHHLNQGGYHGGKRRGHDFTIGLSPWHHQGIPPEGMNERQALAQLGPSYKLHKMAFRARYGTDDQLLETTNKLIALRALTLAEEAVG
jgi:hypothetical protein